jgi:hypothetical protein
VTRPAALLRAWWADLRGAAAAQFIVVLPIFGLIVIGFWAFFSVYSARDALCDASDIARDYLQVEGPRFPEDWVYPDDWHREAVRIIESSLKSQRWYELVPVASGEVLIWPNDPRRSPADMSEVSTDELRNNWFFVRVTKSISNPLAVFLPDQSGEPRRGITLSCQSTGFYEGDPIGPSPGPARGPRQPCPPAQPCPPGPPPPTSTPCPFPPCQPTPCPCIP